jgi:hypothetical protein
VLVLSVLNISPVTETGKYRPRLQEEALDERFCRDRAAETRRLADNLSGEEAKILLQIAEAYEQLAELAKASSAKKSDPEL